MKKTIIASLTGVAASFALVSTSYGQGHVVFENNDFGSLNAPVTFGVDGVAGGNAVTAGWGVGSEFTASLSFSLDGGSSWTSVAGSSTAFLATDGDSANFAGYFFGPTVDIPGYSSGSIMFQVYAWYGGATYADASVNTATGWVGTSGPFTVSSIAAGQSPATPFPAGTLQAFTVNPVAVPEPSTLALAGLGVCGLFMALRKKKS